MPKREREIAYPLMAKRAASRGVALIIAISAFLSERALAQLANSSWPTFRRDAQLTARAQASGPTIPAVKWIARFGNGRLGAPAIGVDGTIYVPGVVDSALYAVAPDGQLRWIFAGTRREEFASSPVVGQDGTIYFGTSKHIFYAVNPNGTERWRLTLGGEVRLSANIGSDGTIYVVAWDNKLYAITPEGKFKWKTPADLKGRRSRNGPAIATDGTIYVVAEEFLMAFNDDGEFQFEHDCRDISVLSGLMVEGNETVYVTALTTAKIKAISTGNAERWKTFFPNDFGPATMPALGTDGAIYFGSVKQGAIFALNHDGTTRWRFSLPGTENLTELALDAANNVYIVNDSLGLISLANDGKLRWSLPEVHCAYSPAFGADGTIYIVSDKKLYAVGPQPPFADSLITDFGDPQSVCIEPALLPSLPIKAKVLDQYGNPFPKQQVNFRVLSGGGSVNPPLDSTDNDGFAQTAWTLGNQPGEQKLVVSSDSLAGSPDTLIVIAKVPTIGGEPVVLFAPTEIKHVSEKAYVIRNDSDCPLRIDSLKVVADASFLFPTQLPVGIPIVIPPHGSMTVRLQFAPTDCGTHEARLCIYSNDPVQPEFCVSLRGAALLQPNVAVVKDSLDFGTVCRATGTMLALPIFNLGCADLKITNVTSTNSAFVVVPPLPSGIPAGGQALLNIKFTPTAAISDTGTLSIFNNDSDKNPLVVNVRGSGGDVDIAGAAEVNFDPVEVQICSGNTNSSIKFYVIRNTGFCDLVVNLPDSVGVVAVSPHGQQIIEPGKSLNVELKFTPSTVGDFVDTLRITNNVPNKSPLLVALHGRGIAVPAIALSPPDTLNFDSVSVGLKKLLPVTITNLGAERLCVDSLVIKSKNFAVETLEFCLECNESKSVDVAFMPDSQGVFIDSLLIYSNDPNGNASKRDMLFMVALGENQKFPMRFASIAQYQDTGTAPIFSNAANNPPAVLYLRGSGSGPEIEVEPDTLEFADCSGREGLQNVTVTNSGNDTLRVTALVFSNLAFSTTLVPTPTPVKPLLVPPGNLVKIPINYTFVAAREDSGTLSIFSNDQDEGVVRVALHAQGNVPDIEVTAPPFGEVCVGTIKLSPLCITNTSDCSLRVEIAIFVSSALDLKTSVTSPSTTVASPIWIGPHQTYCQDINAAPRKPGEILVEVVITTNVPGKEKIIVPIPGTAIPPVIAGDEKVDFGKVLIGASKQDTARVWNADGCEVIINSLKIKGGDASAFSLVPFKLPDTLKAEDTTGILIVFAPKSAGQHTDTLLVFNNDPKHNPLKIALTGIGGDCPAAISVEPAALQYGDVPVGNTISKNLTISNTGCDTLRVTDMRNSLSAIFYVNAADKQFNLAPGVERVVPVFFAPAAEMFYSDTLKIVNNDTTVLVPLNGRGTKPPGPSISVDPESLPFGTVCINVDSIRLVKICNTGTESLRAITISTGTPPFKVEPTGDLLIPTGPDSCRTLTVTFSPATVGNFQDTVTVVWNSSLNLPPLKIPLSGGGIGPRIAGTDTLRFGHVIEKTSLKKFAKVCNVAGCELVINALKVVGKDSLAFSANASGLSLLLAQDECDSIEVTFTPPTPGRFMATLLVSNNDAAQNPFKIVLLGEGDTCTAAISVNPDFLQFGEVALGDTLAMAIKVSNMSDCKTLHVSNIVAHTSAVYFVNLADRQFNLAPSTSRDIKVYFAPAAAIFYGDSLMITSDDPKYPLVAVRLSGNGKLPYTVTPDPLTFPKVCVGSENSLFVTICNISKHRLVASASFITTVGPVFRDEANDLLIPSGSDSCRTIEIIFQPEAVGIFHDTLTVIWHPSLNLPPLKVPLSGEGIGPQISGNKTLDFGEVGIGNKSVMSDTVINNSTCVLRIDKAEIAGKDTSDFHLVDFDPNNLPININPNGHIFLFVEFTPKAPGARTALLNIWSNDPDSTDKPFVVQLHGNGVTGFLEVCKSPNEPRACLGDIITPVAYTLCNVGKAALTIKNMTIKSMKPDSGAAFQFVNPFSRPITLDKNRSTTVPLTFLSKFEGNIIDTLVVDTEEPDSVYRFQLKGFGDNAPGTLAVSNDTLYIQGRLNQVIKREITISNIGCQLLKVDDVDLEKHVKGFEIIDPPKSVFPISLPEHHTMVVTLKFTGYKFSVFKDTLIVRNNDEKQNPKRVPLRAEVFSSKGCLQIPDTLDFPEVVVEQYREKPLILFNADTSNWLEVKAFRTNRQPSEFTVTSEQLPPFKIYPGGSYSFVVRFTPQSSGDIFDRLILETDNADSCGGSPRFVVLHGVGIGNKVYAQPNAFTPNCDGRNDRAKIHFPGHDSKNIVLRIYDLRGIPIRAIQLSSKNEPCTKDLFDDEQEDKQDDTHVIAWNGRDESGRPMLPGAYIWLLEDNGKKLGSGHIVLIR